MSDTELVESVLLPDSTTFIPKIVATTLKNFQTSIVVSSQLIPSTAERFLGAEMVLRKNDVDVIEHLLQTKPSLIVLNNCFYDDNDPLWPTMLGIAKKYNIKLLVLMQMGCPFSTVLRSATVVWVPESAKLLQSVQSFTELKLQRYALE